MSATSGSLYADIGHTGGLIWYSAIDIAPLSANLVLTRNALGSYSLNRIATGAETYTPVIGVNGAVKRLTVYPDLNGMPFQVPFGTAAGGAGYPSDAPGLPPFTAATQLTPSANQGPKGVRVTDVVAVYQVGVADATAASLSLNRAVYANNVAVAVTNVPISATALPLTAAGDATGPYVVTRAVTTTAYEVTDLSDLIVELSITLANTGTLKVFGLGFHVDFNYN